MRHLEFESGTKAYLPDNVSECDQRQFLEVAALTLQLQAGMMSYEDFRIHALYRLLNMKRKESPFDESNKLANVFEISRLVDTFFDDVVDEETKVSRKVLKMNFHHNPIPKIFGSFCTLLGPSDDFNNVTWGEYSDGLQHFTDFNQTGEVIYLYRLAAVFYRPLSLRAALGLRRNGDRRRRYNAFDIERRAKTFERHHIGVSYGFYLVFSAMMKFLATSTIYVHGREIDLSVLFEPGRLISSKQKESDLPSLGPKAMEYMMAESGVFGNVDAVRQVNMWEVYLRLHDVVKKDQDILINQ